VRFLALAVLRCGSVRNGGDRSSDGSALAVGRFSSKFTRENSSEWKSPPRRGRRDIGLRDGRPFSANNSSVYSLSRIDDCKVFGFYLYFRYITILYLLYLTIYTPAINSALGELDEERTERIIRYTKTWQVTHW